VVVLILERVSVSLRGELSRWMLEPRAGVFVGSPPARVRDKLWERVMRQTKDGGSLMVHNANTEQGYAMRMAGDPSRLIERNEGLFLVRVPVRQEG